MENVRVAFVRDALVENDGGLGLAGLAELGPEAWSPWAALQVR